MSNENARFLFKVEDYVILGVTLLLSAGFGLYFSTVKHKQSTVSEYFLAGRNMGMPLVLLSYFASYAAGGMATFAIETYTYGAQLLVFLITIPFIICFVHYLVVPVFYRLNNLSMLKYFEIRFGRTIYIITLVGTIFNMVTIGTVNIYVAVVSVQQVSALTIWVAVSIMTVACIVYSTLGGMRGIVIADAIQAVIMIIAILFIFITGIIKSGGPKAIWDINRDHDRLHLFNMSADPTIRHTFWSSVIGYGPFLTAQLATNQTLLQRCLMTSSVKSSQRMASIATLMTFIYIFVTLALGLTIFGFYKGCHVVHDGSIANINQLIPYFAMEILHEYPCFPGIYFSGLLCATLSTISSNLNSISAIIMSHFMEMYPKYSEKNSTIICKALVIFFGVLMTLGFLIIDSFHNISQAVISFLSVMVGPIFALYCIGILCPQANHKVAAISLVTAVLFGFWIVTGNVIMTTANVTPPFATNCSINATLNYNQTLPVDNIAAYFPLSKASYIYNCSEGIAVTAILFIIITIIFGCFTKAKDQPASQITMDLIPQCVRNLQLKMSKPMRRIFLCDVYSDADVETQLRLIVKT